MQEHLEDLTPESPRIRIPRERLPFEIETYKCWAAVESDADPKNVFEWKLIVDPNR